MAIDLWPVSASAPDGASEVTCEHCHRVDWFSLDLDACLRELHKRGWITVEEPRYHHHTFCSHRCERRYFCRHKRTYTVNVSVTA